MQPGLKSKDVSTLLFDQSASELTMVDDNLLGFQKDVQIKKCFLLSLFSILKLSISSSDVMVCASFA